MSNNQNKTNSNNNQSFNSNQNNKPNEKLKPIRCAIYTRKSSEEGL